MPNFVKEFGTALEKIMIEERYDNAFLKHLKGHEMFSLVADHSLETTGANLA